MNKKGFTLIELLAVIVILAIIAVIAVPIVINIINESKDNATLRSAEMYVKAAELSIANRVMHHGSIDDGSYSILGGGDICLEEYDNTTKNCKDSEDEGTDIDILELEIDGEVPKSGTITITNGNITGLNILINQKEIYKNSKGELVYIKYIDEVCTPSKEQSYSSTPKTAGYKYECKVDPNKDAYTFYVLNTRNKSGEIITESITDKKAVSINLIMAQNINSDGTPTTKVITEANKDDNDGIYNEVPWISKDDYGTLYPYDGSICTDESGCALNDKGPLTAMNFLKEATKNWTNTNEMIVDSFDVEATHNMQTYNIYARMPYVSELSKYDITNKTNAYLYDYLNSYNSIQENPINGIQGYWTFGAYAADSRIAWGLFSKGFVSNHVFVYTGTYYGVRAVINLKI